MSHASPELSRRRNNLDAIRLGGALMVVLGHSYVLSGKPVAPPVIFDVPIHTLGVFVFFIISGYLITKSWLRRPQWKSYLAARSLRIFPALIVAVLLFILGALAGFLAARLVKRGSPPTPQMAIEEGKLIKETVTTSHPAIPQGPKS